jgi:hypothetical protein
MQEKLFLNLVNTTSAPQQVSLFNNPFNQVNNPSATNTQPLYQWDVTSFTFTSEQTVSIQYKLVGASTFTTVSAAIESSTISSVVSALNSLNIGEFYTYTSGLNTYVAIYSESYVYQNLRVYDNTKVEVIYSINVPTIIGTIQFKPSSALTPQVTINLPSNATSYINLPVDVQMNSNTPSLEFINLDIYVNGVLFSTQSIDAVVILDNVYNGGDYVEYVFTE